MIAGNSVHNPSGSIPAKRSLFNKPSWSKPQALPNGAALFHRSNPTYVDHAIENERQRQRKLARKQRERARRAESEDRTGKRQRVSGSNEKEDDDDDDDDDGDDGDEASDESSHGSEIVKIHISSAPNKTGANTGALGQPELNHSPKSLLKRYEDTVAASQIDASPHCLTSHVIDLEDETDGLEVPDKGIELVPKVCIVEDEPVSDEEFPELARQAREHARRKRLEADTVSATPDPLPISQNGCSQSSQAVHESISPPPPSDPVLQILITSEMPDSVPLIVNRRLSQRLKDVKLAWLERQCFPSDLADRVFLTWRGKRLFDVTSCRSLGITAGLNGRILARGDNVVDDEGRIHMEAMTVETLEARKKTKSADPPDQEESKHEDFPPIQQQQEAQVKIICKGRGFPDFKLIVKHSTIISKICNAFRSQNQIGVEREVYLLFDGEKLSPESQVGETELSDMDTIDVVVK